MVLQVEFIELKCESLGDFFTRVNTRLGELGESVVSVQIIANDYRPETYAVITLKSYRQDNSKVS